MGLSCPKPSVSLATAQGRPSRPGDLQSQHTALCGGQRRRSPGHPHASPFQAGVLGDLVPPSSSLTASPLLPRDHDSGGVGGGVVRGGCWVFLVDQPLSSTFSLSPAASVPDPGPCLH